MREFLDRIWTSVLSLLGTTTFSILVFAIGVPIFTFAGTLLWNAFRERRSGIVMSKLARDAFLSPQTLITLGIAIVAWIAALLVGFVRTVNQDSAQLRSLTAENQRLRAELDRKPQLVVRPYVVLEELSVPQIEALVLSDARNPVLPAASYSRAWVFMKARPTNKVVLLYNVRVLPGTIPAHNVKIYTRPVLIGKDGKQKVIPMDIPQGGLVLMPDSFQMQQSTFPPGTMYAGPSDSEGRLRITLVATFNGQQSDGNTYYYRVVLSSPRYASVEDIRKHPIGGISTESTAEGIVGDLNELLK